MLVIYWDTSAILSTLVQDSHTPEALAWLGSDATHVASSLACSEFYASLARLQRDGTLTADASDAIAYAFEAGPFAWIEVEPNRSSLWALAMRSRLRGADLWHLGAAQTLALELPELVLLSFDTRLMEAASAEGLAPPAL